MLVAELLYRRYPELNEGELTRLRAALVSRRHLGQVGVALNLGAHLRLGRAEDRNGGRTKAVLLANCLEALIAALYLEAGLTPTLNFVERTVVHPYMEDLRGELRDRPAIGDYKTALQELLQARRIGQPVYLLQAESGPDHRKRFLVEARASRAPNSPGHATSPATEPRAQGEGTTKKKAEQEAARALYEQLTARTHPEQNAPSQTNPKPAGAHPTSHPTPQSTPGKSTPPESAPPESTL